jgi:uncharacterized phage protein (TIGR01671 family)
MREIKFRGKRIDNTEWIRGGYIKRWNGVEYKHYIHDELYEYEVVRGTVGQYTGLKDKNGTEIYEGDIVTACWYDYEEPSHDTTGIVEFTNGWMGYWIADYDKKEFSELNGDGYYSWTIHIIGNIHDNPELLGGAE